MPRHFFAKLRRGHQPVHGLFISIRRSIGEKRIHHRDRRRQARKRQARTANQRRFVRLRQRCESFAFQAIKNERIHCIASGRRRQRHFHRHLEGPVFLIFCALLDPLANPLFLRCGNRLVRFRRRHDFILVRGINARPQLTALRVAGLDCDRAALGLSKSALLRIQPQFRLTMFRIAPVTGEAFVREDRTDVLIKGTRLRRSRKRRSREERCKQSGCLVRRHEFRDV